MRHAADILDAVVDEKQVFLEWPKAKLPNVQVFDQSAAIKWPVNESKPPGEKHSMEPNAPLPTIWLLNQLTGLQTESFFR